MGNLGHGGDVDSADNITVSVVKICGGRIMLNVVFVHGRAIV